jgi:hypothetical protein
MDTIDAPIAPKPTSIRTQVSGSGVLDVRSVPPNARNDEPACVPSPKVYCVEALIRLR